MAQQKFYVEEFPISLPLEGALVTVLEIEKYTGETLRKLGAAYTGTSGKCIVNYISLSHPDNNLRYVFQKIGYPAISPLFQPQPEIKISAINPNPEYERLLPSGEYYICLTRGNPLNAVEPYPGKSAKEIAEMHGYSNVPKVKNCDHEIIPGDWYINNEICSCWVQTIPPGAFPLLAIYCTKDVPTEPEGVITACNINHLPCPDCGAKEAGQEIEVIAGMKNKGNAAGAFRFYIVDEDTSVDLAHIPTTTRHVAAGDTWGVGAGDAWVPSGIKMPPKTFNGRLELRRYE